MFARHAAVGHHAQPSVAQGERLFPLPGWPVIPQRKVGAACRKGVRLASGQRAVYACRDDSRPAPVGVHSVGVSPGVVGAQQCVKVDYGQVAFARHFLYPRYHAVGHHAVADAPFLVLRRNGQAEVHLGVGGQRLEGVNHGAQVGLEVVLVRPVLRLGVVGAQHDCHHVGRKVQRVLVALFRHVGQVALHHQRVSRQSEVANLVAVAKHALQHGRVALGLRVDQGVALGDAVAHAGNPYLALRGGAQHHRQRQHE